jgi:hypothetical protein
LVASTGHRVEGVGGILKTRAGDDMLPLEDFLPIQEERRLVVGVNERREGDCT